MAEEAVSTPGMTAKGPDYCATPESWEMRPEAQTPAQQLQSFTTTDQEMTTPNLRNYGISDSSNGFMDFAMYETPPGAHLYRDQFAYDICDMSHMDNPNIAECSPPNDTSCDRISSGLNAMPEGSPLEANTKEGLAMKKGTTEQNHDEVAMCAEIQNNHHYIEDSNDKCNKFGVSDLQSSFDINETASQRHEVEECILERLDQQKYPEEDQFVQGQIAPIFVPALCHLLSPKVESVQDVSTCSIDQNIGVTSQTLPDDPTTEEVYPASEEETEHFADYLNTSPACAGKEPWTKDERGEYSDETEVQVQTSSSTPLPSENMNSSLMSMGAPHDAHELNQLADFLSMEDPFKKPLESTCTSPSKDIDYEEPRSISMADEQISSLPTPSKKKKRGMKVHAVNERRRSVRIARRESLLNAPCDAHSHVEISKDITNMVSVYDENNTDAVTTGSGHDHMDQARIGYEAEYVPHPFPEVGESSTKKSTLYCDESKTMELGQMGLTTLMTPNDAETFEHLNIDLPMLRKKKVTNNGRRRSVRLFKQDIQLDEGKSASLPKPAIEDKNIMCDSSFLADFADFRLCDNLMPGDMFGESQFAKTPKEKSGRRKSARLSGVPNQLLELTDKSEVKACGEVEEPSFSDRPIADYQIEDSHMSDNALTVTAKTSVHRDIQGSGYERTESLTEFPFERQDAVQSSRKKKESCSKRRRSVRLVQKPHEQPNCNLDSQGQKDLPSKKAAKGYKKRKPELGLQQDNVLQEVKVTSCDNVSIEPQRKGEEFTILKSHIHVGNPPMELDDDHEFRDSLDVMDFQESMSKASSRISKDTPLTGRKRVSRISQKDKEDDDVHAQEHPRVNTNVDRRQKKSTPANHNGDAKREMISAQRQAEDVGAEESVNENFQITNKIKLMYMKKGAALKKHNLETIFESPKKRATGTPVNILGGRKMKRVVNFTETPWLGRTGRTKGRKVKKGKQVKRILSSNVEKSWKLDVRLSSLDDPSL